MKFAKLRYISLFLFSTFCMQLNAQVHEVGIGAGVANYKGELSPIMNVINPRLHFGVFYRNNLSDALSLRASFSYSRVAQDDANSDDAFATERGHFFRTIILELSAQIEYNFFDFRGGSKKVRQSWTPYLFAGVGVFKIDPLENLQPTYKTIGPCIPLGVGFKAILKDRLNIGAEFGARFTFTDYIDDLGINLNTAKLNTQNPKYYTGNPNDSDMYFFTAINISYVFPVIGKDCPVKIPR